MTLIVRPTFPPFTIDTAVEKVRKAEDGWNSRNPETVAHFEDNGLMRWRHASINDVPIEEAERKFHWDFSGVRPADHPGLSELGL